MFLCAFDVMGIQSYIFRSNALRDNVGASRIIDRVSRDLLFEAGRFLDDGAKWESQELTEANLAAKRALLVYASGGAAQVLLRDRADAERLVQQHRQAILMESLGVSVAADISAWEPATESLAEANGRQRRRLALRKASQVDVQWPELPPVLTRCQRTRSPAYVQDWSEDDAPEWISRTVRAQRWELGKPEPGRGEYQKQLERARAMGLCLSNQIDAIRGRVGEQSFVGLVHLDVNGMGKHFERQALTQEGDTTASVLARLRAESEQVDDALSAAMGATLKWLLDHISKDSRGHYCAFRSPQTDEADHSGVCLIIDPKQGLPALPLRPIVIAGDEITLVCEGSLALDLAAQLTVSLVTELRRLLKNDHITASVGVALGKAHAPFSRLYKLAEASCKRAKDRGRNRGGSWLDYRFLDEPWPQELERRPTTQADPSYRPFLLSKQSADTITFDFFRKQLLARLQGPEGRAFHTQLKSLAGDFASGRAAVERRLALWKERKMYPAGIFVEEVAELGHLLFEGERSPYYDALVLMDFVYSAVGDTP